MSSSALTWFVYITCGAIGVGMSFRPPRPPQRSGPTCRYLAGYNLPSDHRSVTRAGGSWTTATLDCGRLEWIVPTDLLSG
eukprot:12065488-Prorocentrum_lima.AAC.1